MCSDRWRCPTRRPKVSLEIDSAIGRKKVLPTHSHCVHWRKKDSTGNERNAECIFQMFWNPHNAIEEGERAQLVILCPSTLAETYISLIFLRLPPSSLCCFGSSWKDINFSFDLFFVRFHKKKNVMCNDWLTFIVVELGRRVVSLFFLLLRPHSLRALGCFCRHTKIKHLQNEFLSQFLLSARFCLCHLFLSFPLSSLWRFYTFFRHTLK